MIKIGHKTKSKYWGVFEVTKVAKLTEPVVCHSEEKGEALFNPILVKIQWEHKEQQSAQSMLLGHVLNDDDLVFSDNNGKPVLPDTMSHAWVKITKQAGILDIRLHDAGTLMLH
ncbi:MAG: hypothetical protein ABSA18_02805 [Dehalococcoidia bacterium]|jgi:hypothetical protein